MLLQLTGQHVGVGAVRDGENVRRHFVTPLALVDVHGARGVDRVALVRVDGDAEEARVGLHHHHQRTLQCEE